MPFAFTCEQCGVGFTRHMSKLSRFCSMTCKGLSQRTLPDAKPQTCPQCGDAFTPIRKEAAQGRKFCGHACAALFHGTTHMFNEAATQRMADAKRGTGRGDGYVKRGGRHEHRVVAEQELKRPLLPGEIVAHRDRRKANNAPENLIVFPSRSEFARFITQFRGK